LLSSREIRDLKINPDNHPDLVDKFFLSFPSFFRLTTRKYLRFQNYGRPLDPKQLRDGQNYLYDRLLLEIYYLRSLPLPRSNKDIPLHFYSHFKRVIRTYFRNPQIDIWNIHDQQNLLGFSAPKQSGFSVAEESFEKELFLSKHKFMMVVLADQRGCEAEIIYLIQEYVFGDKSKSDVTLHLRTHFGADYERSIYLLKFTAFLFKFCYFYVKGCYGEYSVLNKQDLSHVLKRLGDTPYSLLLKSQFNSELPELYALLGESNFLKMLRFFGDQTISFPAGDEIQKEVIGGQFFDFLVKHHYWTIDRGYLHEKTLKLVRGYALRAKADPDMMVSLYKETVDKRLKNYK